MAMTSVIAVVALKAVTVSFALNEFSFAIQFMNACADPTQTKACQAACTIAKNNPSAKPVFCVLSILNFEY